MPPAMTSCHVALSTNVLHMKIPVDTKIWSLLWFMVCRNTVLLVLLEMRADISNLNCGVAKIIPQHGTTVYVFTSTGSPFKR